MTILEKIQYAYIAFFLAILIGLFILICLRITNELFILISGKSAILDKIRIKYLKGTNTGRRIMFLALLGILVSIGIYSILDNNRFIQIVTSILI